MTRLLGKNLTNKYIYFSNNVTFRFMIRNIFAGKTALHRAAMSGQIDELKKLIQRNEDLNARDNRGDTALHWAAYHGDHAVVTELLENHASMVFSKDGKTAVDIAGICGQKEVVNCINEWLVKHLVIEHKVATQSESMTSGTPL